MAANWMRSKLAKQVAERRHDRARANDRTNWEIVHKPKHEISNDQLVQEYIAQGGNVTKCPVADVRHHTDVGLMGKGKRRRDKRTYGNGERSAMRTHGLAFLPSYR